MEKKDKNEKLFSEFPPVSTSKWEEKIKADLKGDDYEKKLIWKTDEGFSVKPYYRAEDLDGLKYLSGLPAERPFVRGVKTDKNDWIIRQDIFTTDIAAANRIALEAIGHGANEVGLNVREVTSHKQMQQLLAGIDLKKTGINFISSRSYPLTLELFLYEIADRRLEGITLAGSLNFDLISFLLLHGDFYQSEQGNLDEAEYLVRTIGKRLPGFHAITVNGHLYQNAGATLVQELAFSLASGNEYLADLTSKGLPADSIAACLRFSFATGSNYFMEIAKLRAARWLWAVIVEQYKPEDPKSLKMFIHATTSLWNKTLYDPYVNLLRTTTEGMSAVIGNTDSLSVLPFDIPFGEDHDFSRHIARNQQLILKEEAYLDKVVDPAGGSYYIENLTHSIAMNAWNLFREIEGKGGLTQCIKSGFIQDEVEKSSRKKEMDIAQRKIMVLGTNQYPNPLENMSGSHIKLSGSQQDTPSPYRKMHIYRGAQAFESVRLATEKAVAGGRKQPAVFLLSTGNPGMRKARAAFTANFFGCAGYEIIDNAGFDTVQEGVNAALASKAEIVVVCSSDEDYATVVPEACKGIRSVNKEVMMIVAGYPKEIVEMLKSSGADDFIHLRTNVLEFLVNIQKKFGIL
ncbi:MAG: methylmalonyl-CoA mutase family protein [Bacteroidetes bacterium]|nr:methylmalonyl-CoA mutase family protein [Bacteroidota bacterium]